MAECEVCGKEYVQNRAFQKYCSKECRIMATKIKGRIIKEIGCKLTRVCPICGQSFTSDQNAKKYCSSVCSKKARKMQVSEYKRRIRINNEKLEACKKAHGMCFDCPTEDGECLFD